MGGNFLKSTDLAKAILAMNREVPLDSRIRLVIANACMSGLLAKLLSEGIDFVVGHGDSEVGDENAIVFSETLYDHMGGGLSLFASFLSAVLSSRPYQLLAPRCDPSKFLLVSDALAEQTHVSGGDPGNARSAASRRWNELAQWLAENGLVVSHFLVASAICSPVTLAFPVTKHSTSLHAE